MGKLKLYEYQFRLDKWAAVFGVFRLLWLSFNLAYVELTLNAGTLIDEGYCLIFWIQTVTVLLPLGKVIDCTRVGRIRLFSGQVSFILLELFGFLTMTYNAYDTLFLDGKMEGKTIFLEQLQTAFNGDYLRMQFMLKDLRGSMKLLESSLGGVSSSDPLDPEITRQINQFVEKYRNEF